MPPHALLALHLALVAAASQDQGITVKKCCGEMEVLSGDGRSCVGADWPRSASILHDGHGRVVPPLDAAWVQRWLPSGLPLQSVLYIDHPNMYDRNFYRSAVSVNASSVWNPTRRPDENLWRKQVVFFGEGEIARPKPEGGLRRTSAYCVDAALPPLGPHALLFSTLCTAEECAHKCCVDGQALQRDGTYWWCVDDSRLAQLPRNASFSAALDPEFPYDYGMHCARPSLVARHLRTAHLARAPEHRFAFATWRTCADHVRHVDGGALEEAVWYCEHPRLVRGLYRLLRPLCVASVVVLGAALLAVVCDCRMRRKVHGWCLACHAGCLLGFNLGQVAYYVTISDIIDDNYEHGVPSELENVCQYFDCKCRTPVVLPGRICSHGLLFAGDYLRC
ncbi:hypothetical protein R5R35_014083 [Gryllus longicercus]|uniref:Methuselah N-terminal domain-containing protein n=1 Tax=Gryllus longicercus TaxID=2509291 RepID=A0AAN9ZE88_9ORTH